MIKNTFNLIYQSLELDKDFILNHSANLKVKVEFLVKKYQLLFKHFVLKIKPELGKSKIKIGKNWIYYESIYGLANFQAMTVNFEKYFYQHLKFLIKPVILDIGAHLGFFSLTLADFFTKPKIYACEPVNLTYNLLKKNCSKIKSIIPIKLGFSNRNRKSTIYYTSDFLNYSSLFKNRLNWVPQPQSEKVQLTTLDAFINKQGFVKIDILKIDTEGAEAKILQGAKQTLTKTRFLIIEIPLDQVGGITFSSLIYHLYSANYNFQLITIGPIEYNSLKNIATLDLLLENTKFNIARL